MKKTFKLEELCCANCAVKIEDKLNRTDGVTSATVGFMTGTLTIEAEDEVFDEVVEKAQKIIRKIEPDCRIVL